MLRRFALTGFGLLIAIPAWMAHPPEPQTRLDQVLDRGEIIILTRNTPTTYYNYRDRPAGLEYEMGQAFADYLGVRARFEIMDSSAEILTALKQGFGDIAAAGLMMTHKRSQEVLFGPSYQTVRHQVVCHRNHVFVRKASADEGLRLVVAVRSGHEAHLEELKSNHPQFDWEVISGIETEHLLKMVWLEEIDCTLAHSNIVKINRRYFPELVVSFSLDSPQPLAWALPKDAGNLRSEVHSWFNDFKEDGELDTLLERYYGFVEFFDYLNVQTFRHRIREILPYYRPTFENASRDFDIPWTLLAAQGYQESYWNPLAVSPTGVRGIMMLTRVTAKELKVNDRINAHESIMAGAKYLQQLHRRLPRQIVEPDRTWISLAAYNVGMSHIHDAQILSRRLGKNPYEWNDLKTVLPLLAQKQYFQTLKHGYARGSEPVRYVQRIRDFYDILEQSLHEKDYFVRRVNLEYKMPSPLPDLFEKTI